MVLRAGKKSDPDSQKALESLCTNYWYPLYAFARRCGHSVQHSEDHTQGFFAEVLENDYLRNADPDRGRFRTFLLTMFKRYIGHTQEKEAAQKRGGGQTQFSIDFQSGETRYQLEPVENWTPEKIFDRQWGLTLLNGVMDALKQEMVGQGKQQLFAKGVAFVSGNREVPYEQIANELDMTPGALRVAVHRMRDRYRAILKDQIAQTLEDPHGIEDEIEYLRAAIRGDS